MNKRKEIFIQKAIKKHNGFYNYDLVDYKNYRTKVTIVCPKHGPFDQTPDKHVYCGCGCPHCARNVRLTTEEFIKRATAVHGDKYCYDSTDYQSHKTKVSILCSDHGLFHQEAGAHLRGKGCPGCARNKRPTLQEFVERANGIHGNRYDYQFVDYKNNRTNVQIVCPEHGLFLQTPTNHLRGSGCPICGAKQAVLKHDHEASELKRRETMLRKYGVDNIMKNLDIRKKHKLVLSDPEVQQKIVDTKRRNKSFNTSKAEKVIKENLIQLFGSKDVVYQYSDERYPFNCDFYIKSRDLWIEVNGHWTHGCHWYDTVKDKAMVRHWRQKGSSFYKMALDVFTKRDVDKRLKAKESQLNYVVFWKNAIEEFQEWVSLGCPDGQDWLKEYFWRT